MTRSASLPVLCDGGRLNGGIQIPEDPKGALLLLHGIPTIQEPDPTDEGYPGFAARCAYEGWAAAWVDMRGVRGSKGYFSIEGWVRDARAAFDALRSTEGIQGLPTAIVGSSAGGAVACEVTARSQGGQALVMLAAPARWSLMAGDAQAGIRWITGRAGMPLSEETLADPSSWVAEFETIEAESSIVKVKVPTLIVHGTADDVVPVEHARLLAERAPRAELLVLDGAGHSLRRDETALEHVFGWLERHLAVR